MAVLEEPPDPDNLVPPRPARVGTWDGERYVAYYGNTASIAERFKPIYHRTFADAWNYLENSPRGHEIALGDSPKVALWRHFEPGPGAAKKPWDELSERTRQGYRGRMRAQLGLQTEEEFARFHATADSATLKWLRRHGPLPPELVVGPGGDALEPGGTGEWVTTWEQKRGRRR